MHIGPWILWLYGLIFGAPTILLIFIVYKMPTLTGKLVVSAIGIAGLLFLVKWVFVL